VCHVQHHGKGLHKVSGFIQDTQEQHKRVCGCQVLLFFHAPLVLQQD